MAKPPLFFKILENTSRSFYLGINGLKEPERDLVCKAYLFCRLLDIFEDATTVPASVRYRILDLFKLYLGNLSNFKSRAAIRFELEILLKENRVLFGGYFSQNPHELELFNSWKDLLYEIESSDQEILKFYTEAFVDMAEGMQKELMRFQSSSEVRDINDYDSYCYSVAGTVGVFLTLLFERAGAFKDSSNIEDLKNKGISFGKLLQTVNITKDYFKDLSEGRSFWPQMKSGELDVALLLKSLKSLESYFNSHLASAESYVAAIASARSDFKFFCTFPLWMAKANMKKLLTEASWIQNQGHVILSRLDTALIFKKAQDFSKV